MFPKAYSVGTYFGTEIRIHWSVLIVIFLITNSFSGYFSGEGHSNEIALALSFGVSILLYLSIIAHEYGHIFAMRKYGYECKRMTIMVFGGQAEMNTFLLKKPEHEFFVALAGPLVSLALAPLFIILSLLIPDILGLSSLLGIMGFINFILAAFNLLFFSVPADGGRLLRSVIWKVTGNWLQASKICTMSFPVVAILLFLFWLPLTPFNIILFGFLGFIAYMEYPRHGFHYVYEHVVEPLTIYIDISEMSSGLEFYVLNKEGQVTGFLRGKNFEPIA